MNNQEMARKLVKMAKALISGRVENGGEYKVDMNKLLSEDRAMPHYIALLKKEIRKGKGKVEVMKIRRYPKGDMADVFAAGTSNWIMGTVRVPVDALK